MVIDCEWKQSAAVSNLAVVNRAKNHDPVVEDGINEIDQAIDVRLGFDRIAAGSRLGTSSRPNTVPLGACESR